MSDAGENKNIKISVSLDNRAFDGAKQGLRDLTALAKTFVETLNSARVPGGMFSGAASGPKGSQGLGGTPGGTSSAGPVGGLTGAITGMMQGVGSVASTSSAALRTMTSDVKKSVSEQIRDLGALDRKIKDLRMSLGALPQLAGDSVGNLATRDQLAGALRQRAGMRQGINDAARRGGAAGGSWDDILAANSGGAFDSSGGAMQPGAGGTRWSRFNGVAQMMAARAGLGPLAGFLGGAGLAMGGAAGVGLAAAGLYSFGANSYNANITANTQQAIGIPMQALQRQAVFGGTFGGVSEAISGGDISAGVAMQRARRNPQLMGVLNGLSAERERAWRQEHHYYGRGGAGNASAIEQYGTFLAGQVNGDLFGTKQESYFGANLNRLLGPWGMGGTNDSPNEIAFKKWKLDQGAERAGDIANAAAAERARDPRYMNMVNEVYGGAMGRVQAGRLGGFTSRMVQAPGSNQMDLQDKIDAQLQAQGRSFGDLMSAWRQTGQTAGWGLRGKLGLTGTRWAEGGFQGTEGLFGLGAQFGNSQGLLGSIRGGSGRGGMDPVAASQLFGGVGGVAVGSGQYGFGNDFRRSVEGFASAGHTGTTGGDMFMSRAMQAGMGGLQSMQNGSMDRLQGAMNVSAANAAMPGKSWGIKEAVMGLGQAGVDIVRGGAIPTFLRAKYPNGTPDNEIRNDVKAYVLAAQKNEGARGMMGTMAAGSQDARVLGDVRAAGGDFMSVIRSRMMTKGHGSLRSEAERIASALGPGWGLNPTEALGAVMDQIPYDSFLSPSLSGRGPVSAGMSKRDANALGAAAAIKKSNALRRGGSSGSINADIHAAPGERTAEDAAGQATAGAINGFSTAMGNFTAALGTYTDKLVAAIGVMKAGAP